MRLDGALGENICLALQIAILVQYFQRTEQIVGAIVREREAVGAGVEQTVFVGKGIVEPVEFLLCLLVVLSE